jgi:hypothetical protein
MASLVEWPEHMIAAPRTVEELNDFIVKFLDEKNDHTLSERLETMEKLVGGLLRYCEKKGVEMPQPRKYIVEVEYKMRGSYEVTAFHPSQATDIACDTSGLCEDLPANATIVDETFKIVKVVQVGG